MPTQKFYNLDEKKQQQIIDAAEKEFSENLFEDASINKIIKSINMPRGSFYLYFKNKEDIYLYVLELYLKRLKKNLVEMLNQNDGDIFKTVICLFEYHIDNQRFDSKLADNIFSNMNSKRLEFSIIKLLKKEADGYIINRINFDDYYIEESEKDVLMSIIFELLFSNVGRVLSKNDDSKKVREFYIKQINIIKRGLERK